MNAQSESSTYKTTIPANTDSLSHVRKLVLDVASHACLESECLQDFVLAVMEAATNAIRHAKCTSVTLVINVDNENKLTARVIDDGCGFSFNPSCCKFPSQDKESGRGIPIMNSLVDSLSVKSQPNKGTEVILVKKFAMLPTGTA